MTKHFTGWLMIPLLLVVIVLTLPEFSDSLWTDEQRTLWYAGAVPHYGPISPADSIQRVADNLWQAPLYYQLIGVWGRLVGWHPVPLRMFSLFAGLLTIVGVYRLAGRWFDPAVGLYAAFTLGMGAFYINYLHDMRVYALIALLTVIMGGAYWYAVNASRHVWIAYSVLTLSAAGLFYSHYFASFAVSSLGLYHLVFRFRRPRFWAILACFVLSGILFTPWLPVLLAGVERSTHDARLVDNMSPVEMIDNTLMFFSNGMQFVVFVLLIFAFRERRESATFLRFWLLAAVVLMLLVSRVFPALTAVRYMLFLFPLLAMNVGVGLNHLRHVGVPVSWVLAIWMGFAIWWLTDSNPQEQIHSSDWHIPLAEMSAIIEGRTRNADVILFHLDDGMEEANEPNVIEYYTYGWNQEHAVIIPADDATSDAVYHHMVRDAVQHADRVWLSYPTPRRTWRLGAVVEQVLPAQGFADCGQVAQTDDVDVSLFARQSENRQLLSLTVPEGEFGSGNIHLYQWESPQQRAAGVTYMVGWRVDETIFPGLYSLNLALEDASGQVIQTVDIGMSDHQFGCAVGGFDMRTDSASSYAVRLTVYNWQTSDRLPSSDAALWTVTTGD